MIRGYDFDMETSNIWFYSLSTSAQVMAAIFGLFAVFVIFKLNVIDESIERKKKKITQVSSLCDQLELYSVEDLIIETKKVYIKNSTEHKTALRIEELIKERKEIIDSLKLSLYVPAFSIALSLFFLLISFFIPETIFVYLLFINFIIAIVSMGFIIKSILKIIKQ